MARLTPFALAGGSCVAGSLDEVCVRLAVPAAGDAQTLAILASGEGHLADRGRTSYFSLAGRVPETSAMEPWFVTWLYDLVTQAPLVRAAYRRILAGVLAQGVEQGRVLDLGTGPGFLAVELARLRPGLRVVGLDLASHMVKRASQQAAWAGLDGRGFWPQADAHSLPFAEGSFDLVISSFSMHHWQDPLRVLNEMARVLVPGGRYCIADVCREVSFLQRLFAYASIPAVSLSFGSYLGYGGYYESIRAGYTRLEARSLLDRSALFPGEVVLNSTWLVPILMISSRGSDSRSGVHRQADEVDLASADL